MIANVGVRSKYSFESVQEKTFAVVGETQDGRFLGRYFHLRVSWEEHEKNINQSLSYASTSIVPVLGIIVVVLVAALLEVAHRMQKNPEYTLRTLFFPSFRGRPVGERIADLMFDPFFWVFEAACIAILIISTYNDMAGKVGGDMGRNVLLLSGLGALLLPLLYIVFARVSEKYNKKPVRFFFGMFMWGGFAALLSFFVSYFQMPVFSMLGLGAGAVTFSFFATAVFAPIVEETIKGLGVCIASWHHEFDDMLSGLLFGFAVGVGFSFVENWFYFVSKTNPFELGIVPWISLVLYRSFFNAIAHGCFTAATAAVIGYVKSHPRAFHLARHGFLPGLFVAVSLHMIFNVSALLDSFMIANYEVSVFIFNPALVAVMMVMFLAVFVSATNEEKIRSLGKRALEMMNDLQLGEKSK